MRLDEYITRLKPQNSIETKQNNMKIVKEVVV
jgi:hypothetical protein